MKESKRKKMEFDCAMKLRCNEGRMGIAFSESLGGSAVGTVH